MFFKVGFNRQVTGFDISLYQTWLNIIIFTVLGGLGLLVQPPFKFDCHCPLADIVVLLQYGLSPFTLNPFQFNLEFGTTHRVQMCYTSKQV